MFKESNLNGAKGALTHIDFKIKLRMSMKILLLAEISSINAYTNGSRLTTSSINLNLKLMFCKHLPLLPEFSCTLLLNQSLKIHLIHLIRLRNHVYTVLHSCDTMSWIYAHTCIHTCVCAPIHVCACVCVCMYIYICMFAPTHTRTYMHTHTHTHTHIYTHIYVAR